ncbi:MAG: hypothetical protein ACOVVK_24235, partial [Elsteraceae bacterium]
MANSFPYGLGLTRPRRTATGVGRLQGGQARLLGAQLLQRRGEAGVRLGRLFDLALAGGELSGQVAPLHPFKRRPTERDDDERAKADPYNDPPLAEQRDHGASSSAAARSYTASEYHQGPRPNGTGSPHSIRTVAFASATRKPRSSGGKGSSGVIVTPSSAE